MVLRRLMSSRDASHSPSETGVASTSGCCHVELTVATKVVFPIKRPHDDNLDGW